ncbi:TnpV protein [Enterococcus avium]|uniref:TnpV protein n=1 Tax=Enterococcus avium TaxID=33945 RepID=UPI001D072444|nr:TnpV protein [Enterococcus avium]
MRQEGIVVPEVKISINPDHEDPLMSYGKMALSYLRENNQILVQTMMGDGTLMSYLHQKEDWATSQEVKVYQELKQKNPLPETMNIQVVEKHNQMLLSQAKELVTDQLIKSLPTNQMKLESDPFSN